MTETLTYLIFFNQRVKLTRRIYYERCLYSWGRHDQVRSLPEKTVPQIGAEAALLALDDCGLTIQDMQALYCGNLGQASGMVGQRLLQEIGQTGIPVVNVSNACATRTTAFREAWTSIKLTLRRGSRCWCRANG